MHAAAGYYFVVTFIPNLGSWGQTGVQTFLGSTYELRC